MSASTPWKAFPLLSKLSAPIVSAPMANVAGSALAGTIAKAGGFGFIGAGMMKRDDMRREFEKAVEVNGGSRERLGIGLVGFTGADLVDEAMKLKPSAIWLSFGDYREAAAKVIAGNIPLIAMVQSTEEAVRAAAEGADLVVAQGSESGGHGCGPTSTLCFVPEVIDALRESGHGRVPVFAAGGIADGRQMAAALTLGATGAVLGTRFAVSKESLLSDAKQQRYLSAKGGDTVRNRLYDDLGLVEWPQGIDGRLIGNAVTTNYGYAAPQKRDTKEQVRGEIQQAIEDGDLDAVALWCGGGVGQIHSVDGAEDIFKKIWSEASQRLQEMSKTYL